MDLVERMLPGGYDKKYTNDPRKCHIFPSVPRVIHPDYVFKRDLFFVEMQWTSSNVEKPYIHPTMGPAWAICLFRDDETGAEFSLGLGGVQICKQVYNHEILGHLPMKVRIEARGKKDYKQHVLIER
jgi:hypothetical protein